MIKRKTFGTGYISGKDFCNPELCLSFFIPDDAQLTGGHEVIVFYRKVSNENTGNYETVEGAANDRQLRHLNSFFRDNLNNRKQDKPDIFKSLPIEKNEAYKELGRLLEENVIPHIKVNDR